MLTVAMTIALNRVWHSRAAACSRGEMAGWKGEHLENADRGDQTCQCERNLALLPRSVFEMGLRSLASS